MNSLCEAYADFPVAGASNAEVIQILSPEGIGVSRTLSAVWAAVTYLLASSALSSSQYRTPPKKRHPPQTPVKASSSQP